MTAQKKTLTYENMNAIELILQYLPRFLKRFVLGSEEVKVSFILILDLGLLNETLANVDGIFSSTKMTKLREAIVQRKKIKKV